MKFLGVLLVFLALIMIPLISGDASAATWRINIPSGAASPDAPYFWQSEKDGATDGSITVNKGDSIEWANADTAAHTVTSGEDGVPSGKFDSGLFGPGKSFTQKFDQVGQVPYFCIVHPWMTGMVKVVSGLQVIPKVGAGAGDGKTTFDVEYEFNRVITDAKVNQQEKAITFTIVGKAGSEDNTLTLKMPKKLLEGPYVMFSDGQQIEDFEKTDEGEITSLKIPLDSKSEQLTIIGTKVVPEFGTVAMLILAVSVVAIIILRSKLPFAKLPNQI